MTTTVDEYEMREMDEHDEHEMDEHKHQELAEHLPDTTLVYWSWASASLLIALAACLTLFPRLLLFVSESSLAERRTALTPLESFLALHFGVFLAALACALVLNVPSPSPPVQALPASHAPAQPLLGPLSLAAVLSAFLAWNTNSVGPLASLVFTGSLLIGLWGLWAIVFANDALRSRKTGADKRTSAFLFGNKAAASVQKKNWKKARAAPQ